MKTKAKMEKLLTVNDLAELLQQERQTVYKNADSIPGRIKLNGALRFRESAIRDWINSATEKSTK